MRLLTGWGCPLSDAPILAVLAIVAFIYLVVERRFERPRRLARYLGFTE